MLAFKFSVEASWANRYDSISLPSSECKWRAVSLTWVQSSTSCNFAAWRVGLDSVLAFQNIWRISSMFNNKKCKQRTFRILPQKLWSFECAPLRAGEWWETRRCQQIPTLPLKLHFCWDYQPHPHLRCATGMSVSPMSPSGFPGLARISGQDVVCSPIATELLWQQLLAEPSAAHPGPTVCGGSALGPPGGDGTGIYCSFLEWSALTVPPA